MNKFVCIHTLYTLSCFRRHQRREERQWNHNVRWKRDGAASTEQVTHKVYSTDHKTDAKTFHKNVRAAKLFAAILVNFSVMWLPINIHNCVTYFDPGVRVYPELLMTCIVLSHANSTANPVIYAASVRAIRRAMMDVASCRGNRRQQPDWLREGVVGVDCGHDSGYGHSKADDKHSDSDDHACSNGQNGISSENRQCENRQNADDIFNNGNGCTQKEDYALSLSNNHTCQSNGNIYTNGGFTSSSSDILSLQLEDISSGSFQTDLGKNNGCSTDEGMTDCKHLANISVNETDVDVTVTE